MSLSINSNSINFKTENNNSNSPIDPKKVEAALQKLEDGGCTGLAHALQILGAEDGITPSEKAAIEQKYPNITLKNIGTTSNGQVGFTFVKNDNPDKVISAQFLGNDSITEVAETIATNNVNANNSKTYVTEKEVTFPTKTKEVETKPKTKEEIQSFITKLGITNKKDGEEGIENSQKIRNVLGNSSQRQMLLEYAFSTSPKATQNVEDLKKLLAVEAGTNGYSDPMASGSVAMNRILINMMTTDIDITINDIVNEDGQYAQATINNVNNGSVNDDESINLAVKDLIKGESSGANSEDFSKVCYHKNRSDETKATYGTGDFEQVIKEAKTNVVVSEVYNSNNYMYGGYQVASSSSNDD